MQLTIIMRIKIQIILYFLICFHESGQTEYKIFPPNESVQSFGDYTSSNGKHLAVSSFFNMVNIYNISNDSIVLDTIIVTKETGTSVDKKFYIDDENFVCAGYGSADSISISFYKKQNDKWGLIFSKSFYSQYAEFARGFCVTDNYAFVSCNYFNYDKYYQLNNDSSKIFVFRKIANKWEFDSFINGSINLNYGIAIDCDDSTLIIGSARYLYFYSLENTNWILKKQVESNVRDISISNNYVAVANPLKYISIYRKDF